MVVEGDRTMLRNRLWRAAVLGSALVLSTSCGGSSQDVESVADDASAVGPLAAPTTPSPEASWPAFREQVNIRDCREVERTLGAELLYLADKPDAHRDAECFVDGDPQGSELWSLGVMYVTLDTPESASFPEILRNGGFVLQTIFNDQVWSIPRGSDRAASSGGYEVVSLRGSRGVLQRVGPAEYRLSWTERLGARTDVHVVLSSGGTIDADRVLTEAKQLQRTR